MSAGDLSEDSTCIIALFVVASPHTGEVLLVRIEAGNIHDQRAVTVALLKADGTVDGHVSREVSRIFWHYPRHGGKIS